MDNTLNKRTKLSVDKQRVLPENVRQQYLEAMGVQTWFDPVQVELQHTAQTEMPQENKATLEVLQNKVEPAHLLNTSVDQQKIVPLAIEREVASQPQVVNAESPSSINALNLSIEQCQLCELHTTRKQAVCGEGNLQADLFIIIDSPIDDNSSDNALLNSENKKMLQAMLSAIGFDLASVFMSSLVKCQPPQQRVPQTSEVICCDEHLSSQIKLIQPQAILVLGELASQQLLVSQKSLTDLRLRHHQHIGVPVFASYHPHELFNSSETKRKVWADLLQIKRQVTNLN